VNPIKSLGIVKFSIDLYSSVIAGLTRNRLLFFRRNDKNNTNLYKFNNAKIFIKQKGCSFWTTFSL